MPGPLLQDVLDVLVAAGLVDGGTGWKSALSNMPPDPDQVVALFETPGQAPGAAVDIDYPGFQVRVRGNRKEYDVARAKLEACYLALHKLTGTLSGTYYISILASGSVLPLGEDGNERPEITQNFQCQRSRG